MLLNRAHSSSVDNILLTWLCLFTRRCLHIPHQRSRAAGGQRRTGIQVVSQNPLPSSASRTRKLPPLPPPLSCCRHSPKSTAISPGTRVPALSSAADSNPSFHSSSYPIGFCLNFCPLLATLPNLAQPPMSRSGPITAPGGHDGCSHVLIHGTGTYR